MSIIAHVPEPQSSLLTAIQPRPSATRRNNTTPKTPKTAHPRCNRAQNCTPTPEMAPWPETPYSCLRMPYASKADPAPHKGTYRFKNGPVVSGPALSPHEWTRRLTNGTTAPQTDPSPQKRPHCLKNGRDASGTGPPPQNWMRRLKSDPAVSKVSKMGPLHHKRTRRVRDGPTASKLDPSPQKRPRRLKSGPEVSKSEPPHHE
ncbi:hypothetical protein BU15DRAFT_59000 [Melanogaster broomeanus]|nr:hypothetical protein BU15DRAFT_59000 [Melanogaster broomeanus]